MQKQNKAKPDCAESNKIQNKYYPAKDGPVKRESERVALKSFHRWLDLVWFGENNEWKKIIKAHLLVGWAFFIMI